MNKTLLRIVSVILCLLLAIGLVGCGKDPAPVTSDDPTSTDASDVSDRPDAPSDSDTPDASDPVSGEDPATSDDPANPDSSENPDDPTPTKPGQTTKATKKGETVATQKTTAFSGKETTVKVGSLTVHSGQTPYVTGGTLPITMLLPYTTDSADMSGQAFTSYYEKMSGIKVTYNFYKGSDIFVLTQTMMASGNLPDIFMSVPVGFTCSKVSGYAKDGFYADLTDKLETWAPNLYAKLNSPEHKYAKAIAYAPGKVYSLPSISPTTKEGGNVINTEECQLMINKAWLDELGLKVPTTTDEWYTVAKAFTEEDPDGNGKNDTFGYGIDLFRPQLWNAWGLGMSWYYTGTVTEKGQVLSGLLTDQFREGCRFYNRLWKEGIFNKQMIGSEGAAMKTQVHKTGIVSMSYIHNYLSDSELDDWTVMSWPKAANTGDLLSGITMPNPLDCQENMFFVSAKTKSVEACLRWLDYFYTPDGAMLWHYGPAGKAYTKVGDKYKLVKNTGNVAADQKILCSFSPMGSCNVLSRNSSELTTREKYVARMQKEANQCARIGKYNFSQLVQLATDKEQSDISRLQQPGDVQWGYRAIRGEVNVETDWNSYKNNNSKDYAAWQKIYQAIFDRTFK